MKFFIAMYACLLTAAGNCRATTFETGERIFANTVVAAFQEYAVNHAGELPAAWNELPVPGRFSGYVTWDESFQTILPTRRYAILANPLPVASFKNKEIVVIARRPFRDYALSPLFGLSRGAGRPGRWLVLRNPVTGEFDKKWVSEKGVQRIFAESGSSPPAQDTEPSRMHTFAAIALMAAECLCPLLCLASVGSLFWWMMRRCPPAPSVKLPYLICVSLLTMSVNSWCTSYQTIEGTMTQDLARAGRDYSAEHGGMLPEKWSDVAPLDLRDWDEKYRSILPTKRYAFLTEPLKLASPADLVIVVIARRPFRDSNSSLGTFGRDYEEPGRRMVVYRRTSGDFFGHWMSEVAIQQAFHGYETLLPAPDNEPARMHTFAVYAKKAVNCLCSLLCAGGVAIPLWWMMRAVRKRLPEEGEWFDDEIDPKS